MVIKTLHITCLSLLLVSAFLFAGASAQAQGPAMSWGADYNMSISQAECENRAKRALQIEGFSQSYVGPGLLSGGKGIHSAYINCKWAPGNANVEGYEIVVASSASDGSIPGAQRVALQRHMYEASTVGGTGSGITGTWNLTTTCGYYARTTINLTEGANASLTGAVQNDPLSPEVLADDKQYGNSTGQKSQRSGNAVTLVLHPSAWVSVLDLSGTLSADGNKMTGTIHHYGNDDCTFTMIRVFYTR